MDLLVGRLCNLRHQSAAKVSVLALQVEEALQARGRRYCVQCVVRGSIGDFGVLFGTTKTENGELPLNFGGVHI